MFMKTSFSASSKISLVLTTCLLTIKQLQPTTIGTEEVQEVQGWASYLAIFKRCDGVNDERF